MKTYAAKDIRNIALVGHAGAGKTSLAEAAYYLTGQSDRLGKVADGTTVCDFDPEEIKRQASVSTAVLPMEWSDIKVNLLDTPGLFDFAGGMSEGIRAAGCALIVVSGKGGLEVGAEKAFRAASKKGIAKLFFVNKMDEEHADFYKVYQQLLDTYGKMICPMVLPHVVDGKVECFVDLIDEKAYVYKDGIPLECPMPEMERAEEFRTKIREAVAETSEELMEKYFNDEPFTHEELVEALSGGVRRGEIAPVFCGSATTMAGLTTLFDGMRDLAPWAETVAGEVGKDGAGNDVKLTVDPNGPTVAIVFKTIADPFVGKLLYFKVISGKVSADSTLVNMRTGANEKIGKVYFIRGKKQEETAFITAGDIGGVAKLATTRTGDTLCSVGTQVTLNRVPFENPCLSVAVSAKKKGEEEKIASGLDRLMEEDPTIHFEVNKETKESILSGLGEQHLDVVASKLKSKFGVEVDFATPRVAYRETIRKKVKVQGRHKKQSGGHGQFGDVWVEFEPWDCDGLIFEETVFGGSVPKNFFPAVEKGLVDSAQKGVLAGFPVVGVKATLVDGSYHPVDSSEMAFKTAASLAYKEGMAQASPAILEPIGVLKAYVPGDNTGDVMGDATKRRGRVLGMNPAEDDLTCVEAEVPMAEMGDYAVMLRSLTQGRGHFTLDFERYEQAPEAVAQKVVAEYKVADDE
ncbi:MAG: elongation factor G [Clostridia bacterium]|nr:elongation factor G [Clostridia bacterium]